MYIWKPWANVKRSKRAGSANKPSKWFTYRKTAFSSTRKRGAGIWLYLFYSRVLVFSRCLTDTGKNHNICMVCRLRREQMEDLTVEQVEAIHTRVMTEEKGDCRVLSEANLHQMVFHANLIPDCMPRAAFIFYFLCAYLAFREGNFRTAIAVTEQVLLSGGYRISGEKAGIMALAAGIVAFIAEPEEIEQWLCNNIQESVSR